MSFLSILTDTTCGYPCWAAEEDVCRCSCGGRNHGIMKRGGTAVRTARIDGRRYKLLAVGTHGELEQQAMQVQQAIDIKSGKAYERDGKLFTMTTYYGPPRETPYRPRYGVGKQAGEDVRVKYASLSQCMKWPELAQFEVTDTNSRYRSDATLLWVREDVEYE